MHDGTETTDATPDTTRRPTSATLLQLAERHALSEHPTMRQLLAVEEAREIGCPWRWLEQHPEIKLLRRALPAGEWGRYYPDLRVMIIDDRMGDEAARDTLAHEIAHILRGDQGSVGNAGRDEQVEEATDELAQSVFGPYSPAKDVRRAAAAASELARRRRVAGRVDEAAAFEQLAAEMLEAVACA